MEGSCWLNNSQSDFVQLEMTLETQVSAFGFTLNLKTAVLCHKWLDKKSELGHRQLGDEQVFVCELISHVYLQQQRREREMRRQQEREQRRREQEEKRRIEEMERRRKEEEERRRAEEEKRRADREQVGAKIMEGKHTRDGWIFVQSWNRQAHRSHLCVFHHFLQTALRIRMLYVEIKWIIFWC